MYADPSLDAEQMEMARRALIAETHGYISHGDLSAIVDGSRSAEEMQQLLKDGVINNGSRKDDELLKKPSVLEKLEEKKQEAALIQQNTIKPVKDKSKAIDLCKDCEYSWCTHGYNFCRHLLRPFGSLKAKKIARQVTIDHSRQLPSGLLISLFCYSTSSFMFFPVLAYLNPSPPRSTSSPIT